MSDFFNKPKNPISSAADLKIASGFGAVPNTPQTAEKLKQLEKQAIIDQTTHTPNQNDEIAVQRVEQRIKPTQAEVPVETVKPIEKVATVNGVPVPEVAPVASVAPVNGEAQKEKGVGDKIKDLVKKYGVGLASVLEAGAKGYVGDTSKTAFELRNEQAYKEKENEFFKKLQEDQEKRNAERAVKEAGLEEEIYNRRASAERAFQASEAEKDRNFRLGLSVPVQAQEPFTKEGAVGSFLNE